MTGVDIGCDPALTFSAHAQNNHEPSIDRRRLNLRWLACSILTGVAGASLMGGALFIAVDRQSDFAEIPVLLHAAAAASSALDGAGKGDRHVIRSEHVSQRQVIQETSVRRIAGKEFVQVAPYISVAASLAMTKGAFAEEAPPFNPLKIYATSEEEGEDGHEPAEMRDDDILEMRFTDLAANPGALDQVDVLDEQEIEQTIREMVSFVASDVAYAPPVVLPVSATAGTGALEGSLDPFPAIAPYDLARFSGAANMTTVAKQVHEETADPETEEIGLEVRRGDTLMSILMDHGATRTEAMELIAAVKESGDAHNLREGEEIRLTVAPAADDPERHRPVKLTMTDPDGTAVTASLPDVTPLVRLSTAGLAAPALRPGPSLTSAQAGPRANVYDGIYETALQHQIPRELVDELVRIFAFDVDFQRTVSMGDLIEVFYAETGEGLSGDEPQIHYAAITLRGETRRFYRFRTPDDGVVDYYDETGRSAKKFLMRKPVSSGSFRSGFGMRRHPILGYSRMHSGADWAARSGTPIMSAGNGTVTFADWRSGYGRQVQVRHANGYETSYSHMSGFAKGIEPGVRVRQGQVIGYVGSSGLSTGPHLHYEVMVNGRHVDPMRIKLPRGRVLEGRVLAAFEKEKARIEALMNRAPASTRVASR